ncbi:hypothetical protein BAUCODRAFT_125399 [Baudoinia panamericana UAMH 10762]|uniref:C2H2-type domain-containing protein n=1 Tax=Baudoinia panamericana (strain UAMH 10762) TaxID=717646 RepID=M2N4C8_BAUPA|nr:uncharacterized protein BAUCODRAFT_125399 [Baudoinia panamericana UAMH 10762]EMC93545.1 hypothetical protein BAUCODRAFT_125399 [Baudoinia panamericana UAMH 10762]
MDDTTYTDGSTAKKPSNATNSHHTFSPFVDLQLEAHGQPQYLTSANPGNGGSFDVDEINRMSLSQHNPPFMGLQRHPQLPLAISYQGAPGYLSEQHDRLQQRYSGNQATKLTDSAYGSLSVTSGPTPFHSSIPAHQSTCSSHEATEAAYRQRYHIASSESVASGSANGGGAQKRPSQRSARSRSKPAISPCQWCGKELKNPSDAHKHELQHTKPHRCDEPGCGRSHEGFATQNDLQRHRSSVHKRRPLVGCSNGYVCIICIHAHPNSGKPKFWLRRDNFKAHVKRKHADHDADAIVKRSAAERPEDAETVESGYCSQPSQVDPFERHLFRPDIISQPICEDPDLGIHNSNLVFAVSSNDPGNQLAGVGEGADRLSIMPSTHQDPSFAFPIHDLGDGLSMLSKAAVTLSDLSSLAESLMPKPSRHFSQTLQRPVPHLLPQVSPFNYEPSVWKAQAPKTSEAQIGHQSDPLTPSDAGGAHKCDYCTKTTKRECDLRKHTKRHTRPYGCTDPYCFKPFGSRNDWKRHEKSQHRIREAWRCNVKVSEKTCGKLVYARERMRSHIKRRHAEVRTKSLDALCNGMHLGDNASDQFWCGFCEDLVPCKADVQKPGEYRMKHIGDHYDKDDKHINDWVCVMVNKRRKDFINDVEMMHRLKDCSRTGRAWSESGSESEVTTRVRCQKVARCPSLQGESPQNVGSMAPLTKKRKVSAEVEVDADGVSDDEWNGGATLKPYERIAPWM